jgi:two-component system, chemotaxis family, CheB/CheR fusion protein
MESRIVGIGASAGGLESLEQLFSALPADTGMAFVVVQHLSPDFRSMMDELIGRHSAMPVVLAENGMAVEPDHVYLLPPRKEMIIRDRHLVLTDKEPNTFSLPIDTFFRSLAHDAGDRAVAIVLSGSGSDGSRGVVDVQRAGGLVMVESPNTAAFDGMPQATIATGATEHIYAPRDLARVLCGLPPLVAPALENEALSEDPAMDQVLRLLREEFGIDFSLYKMTTVGRRVQRRVEMLRLEGLVEYVTKLRSDPGELDELYQDLLIGVTQFFRDPDAFEVLGRDVIPGLLSGIPAEEEVRLWVAGCGTGEEAYSIAMLFLEALEAAKRPVRLKILATDVHQQSLEFASTGVYGEEQLSYVTPGRLSRYFTRRSSGYQVSQELRQMIVFARHNVTKDAPFTKMHFISCRNMLIYFQPHAQRSVMSLFHFGLASGGILFLGASETPGTLADEFVSLDERWKIYRKRRDIHLLSHVRLPLHRQTSRRPAAIDLPRPHGPDPLMLQTYDQLLDRFMPPGFLIDEERLLVDSFAGAEKILRLRRRRPSTNILDLLDDELRSVVAGAIQRAFKDGRKVVYTGVRVPTEDGEIRCSVNAEPLVHPRTNVRHVLLTFPDLHGATPDASPVEVVAHSESQDASRERMASLESELNYTRETLQATVEELETSNEEMQATNEELVAANEELQSTNEELHSVNEELYTVNAEYQQKIQELRELNADMAHLLEGTNVGTVFLDGELRIRRFTSQIANVFRFQQFDIGRQIRDFSHNILRAELLDEIERVRAEGIQIEDEVRDRNGTPYFLRILPYRIRAGSATAGGNGAGNAESQIAGVVLTLTDISALDGARARLRELAAIIEWCDDAIIGATLDGTIRAWNRGAEELFGYAADEAVGKNLRVLMLPEDEPELDDVLQRVERGERIEHLTSLRHHKDGRALEVSTSVSSVLDSNGQIVGLSAIGRDVSMLVAANRELEARQAQITALLEQTADGARRREQFLAMLSHELRNPLAAVMNAATLLERKPGPDVFVRCQSVIDRQTQHMKRLLDDLLDVSRITRGKFDLQIERIDLRQPIEAAIESVQPLYELRKMALTTVLPPKPMPILGDPSRLMQVAVNLLSNAANYSPRGSSVRLDVNADGGHAVMLVIDHGIGIEPELQERIFELFVQTEQRLDRSHGGLGVGLSLAKNIVELHGGAIEVTSEGRGHGAVFKVTLPLADSASATESAANGATGGERRRIVVVDDQEDSREMLKLLLEERDHVVLDAADGPSALDLIARERPDVAFIDIGLPIMTGYEIAKTIRARSDLNGVLLVALTGYGAPGDVVAVREAGFDEHLIKPADIARIDSILSRRVETASGHD